MPWSSGKKKRSLLEVRFFVIFLILLADLQAGQQIRVATYNTSLALTTRGRLAAELRATTFNQARQIAEVIQMIEPDIILLNEFDYDAGSAALTRFNNNYLAISQNGQTAQNYPYRYTAPSNTGIHSGFDLDHNNVIDNSPGDTGYGGDAFGFGEFEGKYGMAILSKFPVDTAAIRTFQLLKWQDMPGNLIPTTFYTEDEKAALRLSSKSHWDIPVEVNGQRIHLLCSHPTPPVFDGPEDRNGRRNHDEIRLWADFLTPANAGYLTDDQGNPASLPETERFILLGDQNADPTRGDSFQSAINQWLNHPRIDASFTPKRTGTSTPTTSDYTASFSLRVDYVLPSKSGFEIRDGAVFWPTGNSPGANRIGASDHRPVYLDLEIIPTIEEAVRDLIMDSNTLTWKALPDITYQIETSTDLDNWSEFSTVITIINGQASADISPALPIRFLRVKVID
ncbi:MAG: endonuclease/exonuclease/phosphatase family protein [Akkermansiaceae bacterium]